MQPRLRGLLWHPLHTLRHDKSVTYLQSVFEPSIAAQCVITVLEFCNGDIAIDGFAPTFGYSAALLASAVTTGRAHSAFTERVQQSQAGARRQHNARLSRTPGQVGAGPDAAGTANHSATAG